ncbi:MAG TPA: ATP-binding protein [Vicinamibacteria bacterium]
MALLSSLRNRIFLAGALVAVLSVAVAIQVVTRRVTVEAEADLRRSLDRAARLVQEQQASRLANLTAQVHLIADLPTLKAAVATSDAPTVRPVVEDLMRRVRSDFLEVADASGRTLASLGGPLEAVEPEVVGRALRGEEVTTFRTAARGVLQVITVPIVVGPVPQETLGTLSLGFALDDGLALQFKGVTDSEVAFAFGGRVRASTLPGRDDAALSALLGQREIRSVTLGASEYVAMSRRLPVASGEGPVALILRSRTERLQLLGSFRTALLGASVVGLLVAVVLSYAVARTVTRPLADLTKVMKEMTATGDLARRIVVPGVWGDEDAAVLARAFGALTEAIERFRREAALRERLSALGRLSTVIAHEVRNPLMIIKSSLAALRREGATAVDVREAVLEIEEEVARLNRLVDGVLDFARPLRLEYSPTDLGALCREAAAVVMGGAPDLSLSVEDTAPVTALTDAERLRTVLLNVIGNAKEAAAQRRAGPGSPRGRADVSVTVQGVGEGRAAIVVEDRGPGIPEADLPNLFEPYFTTKRTGTGLGLAIAKNIVDALGGIIGVTSVVGEGTRVRIEIPTTGPLRGRPS